MPTALQQIPSRSSLVWSPPAVGPWVPRLGHQSHGLRRCDEHHGGSGAQCCAGAALREEICVEDHLRAEHTEFQGLSHFSSVKVTGSF